MILYTLKKSLLDFYNNIFNMIIFSFVSFIEIILLVYLTYYLLNINYYLGVLILLILSGPFLLAHFTTVKTILTNDINFKTIFVNLARSTKKYFIKGIKFVLFSITIYFIILTNAYYLFLNRASLFMLVFMFISIYLLLFFTSFEIYLCCLITVYSKAINTDSIKEAFYLTVKNPGYSLSLLLLTLMISVILIMSLFGIAVALVGFIIIISINGVVNII